MNRRTILGSIAALLASPASAWAAVSKPRTFVWWNSKGERFEAPLLSTDESRKLMDAWREGAWGPVVPFPISRECWRVPEWNERRWAAGFRRVYIWPDDPDTLPRYREALEAAKKAGTAERLD